jgi:hypothetical protein
MKTLRCPRCKEVMSFDGVGTEALAWLDRHFGHGVEVGAVELGPCFRCGKDGPVGTKCDCSQRATPP